MAKDDCRINVRVIAEKGYDGDFRKSFAPSNDGFRKAVSVGERVSAKRKGHRDRVVYVTLACPGKETVDVLNCVGGTCFAMWGATKRTVAQARYQRKITRRK